MAANARKSKKRSAANSSSQLERIVFFIDRSLGRRVVSQALRACGETVIVHDDRFPQDAHDRVWLREAGAQGWVVLTKDSKIRYRQNEITEILSARVRSFVLVSRNLLGSEMARIFAKALPAMKKVCASQPAPFIAHVWRDGKVVVMAKAKRK
jgi:predicted nuclease of predicted toxin-antitoxin system